MLYINQSRATAGNNEMFTPVPAVRFHCNYNGTTNTSTQIYDDISAGHLIGTFSDANDVRYVPFGWHWYDSAAFHQN
jgi:hypothetical protein